MKRLLILVLVALGPGCQVGNQPGTTLSDEELAKIMSDLYVAEAATTGMSGWPKDSLMKVYYLQVFEIHGTTAETYEHDLKIASQDLNRLKEIVAGAQKLLEGSQNSQNNQNSQNK